MTYSAEYATDHPTRDEVEAIREPTVVEFGQPGCGYCQAAAPLIKAAFADFTGVVHLKLEDAKGRLLGRAFKVKQWPTLIFLQEGRGSGASGAPAERAGGARSPGENRHQGLPGRRPGGHGRQQGSVKKRF